MLVKAGSTLLVPRADDAPQHPPGEQCQRGLRTLVVLKRFVVRARKETRCRWPTATICRQRPAGWNRSKSNAALKPGQAVVVYLPVRAGASAAAAAVRGTTAGPDPPRAVNTTSHKADARHQTAKQHGPAKRGGCPKAKTKTKGKR